MRQLTLLALICLAVSATAQNAASKVLLDPYFNGSGYTYVAFPEHQSSTLNDMAILSNGKIIVVGSPYNDVGLRPDKGFSIACLNPDGSFDPAFGTGGKVTTAIFGISEAARSVLVQPDGKIVAGGHTSNPQTNSVDFALIRYQPDGKLDPTFGNGGIVVTDLFNGSEDYIYAIALTGHGQIVAAGVTADPQFTNSDFGLVKYNPDGTLDQTFGNGARVKTDFEGLNDFATAVAIQKDGKIVAAGLVSGQNLITDFGLVRYHENGSLDLGFNGSGKVRTDFVNTGDTPNSLTLQEDGKIVVAGYGQNTTLSVDVFVARYLSNGALDPGFGNAGKVMIDIAGGFDFARDVITAPGGKLLLTGESQKMRGGDYDVFLLQLQPDGSLDVHFDDDGIVTTDLGRTDIGNSVAIRNGKIYVAGTSSLHQPYGVVLSYIVPNAAVTFTCPNPVIVNTDPGLCAALVSDINPVFTPTGQTLPFSFQLNGATTGNGSGSASGLMFNKGQTAVTYTLDSDPTKTCSFNVTVNDKEPPLIKGLSVSKQTLWPANHKMVDVWVNYSSSDACGAVENTLTVSSNETPKQKGSGNTNNDWEIVSDHLVRLRAERSGNGQGRIYTITVTAKDMSGNIAAKSTTVAVPRSMAKSATSQNDLPVEHMQLSEPALLKVHAYPNPSTNNFAIRVAGAGNGSAIQLIVRNAAGQVIEERKIKEAQTIHIGAAYTNGVYYVEAIAAQSRASVMLVKGK